MAICVLHKVYQSLVIWTGPGRFLGSDPCWVAERPVSGISRKCGPRHIPLAHELWQFLRDRPFLHEPRCYSMLISSPHPVNLKCDSEMRTPTANYSNISRNTPILLAFFECFGTPFPSRPPGPSPWSSGFDGSLHGFQGRAGQSCGAVPSAFRPILDRKPWGPDGWKSVKPMGFTGNFWSSNEKAQRWLAAVGGALGGQQLGCSFLYCIPTPTDPWKTSVIDWPKRKISCEIIKSSEKTGSFKLTQAWRTKFTDSNLPVSKP